MGILAGLLCGFTILIFISFSIMHGNGDDTNTNNDGTDTVEPVSTISESDTTTNESETATDKPETALDWTDGTFAIGNRTFQLGNSYIGSLRYAGLRASDFVSTISDSVPIGSDNIDPGRDAFIFMEAPSSSDINDSIDLIAINGINKSNISQSVDKCIMDGIIIYFKNSDATQGVTIAGENIVGKTPQEIRAIYGTPIHTSYDSDDGSMAYAYENDSISLLFNFDESLTGINSIWYHLKDSTIWQQIAVAGQMLASSDDLSQTADSLYVDPTEQPSVVGQQYGYDVNPDVDQSQGTYPIQQGVL